MRACRVVIVALAIGTGQALPARAEGVVHRPSVTLDVDPCVPVDAAELARAFVMEQEMVLGGSTSILPAFAAQIHCDGAVAILRVTDATAALIIERRLILSSFSPAMRPRLLALFLTELAAAMTTARELGGAGQARHTDGPATTGTEGIAVARLPPPRPAPPPAPWALIARGTGEWQGAPSRVAGGVSLALRRILGRASAAGGDLEWVSATMKASLGDVQVTRLSTAPTVMAEARRDRWAAAAGAGVRLGVASLGGTAAIPAITEARSATRWFWGPVAVADLRVTIWAPLVAQLAVEGGVYALPLVSKVGDRLEGGSRGPWLKAACGLGVAF